MLFPCCLFQGRHSEEDKHKGCLLLYRTTHAFTPVSILVTTYPAKIFLCPLLCNVHSMVTLEGKLMITYTEMYLVAGIAILNLLWIDYTPTNPSM